MTLPYILENNPGNKPDADKFMANYFWLLATLRGNFLNNGGMEGWGAGTSFASVASGVNVADGWQTLKSGTLSAVLDIAREATTKDSGAYSLKMVMQTAGSSDSIASIQQQVATPERFSDQTVFFSVKVKCATANKVRLKVYDGTTTAYSAYHTGDGTWQRLSVALACSATPSVLRCSVSADPANFDTDTVYVDSAFLYVIDAAMTQAARDTLDYFAPAQGASLSSFSVNISQILFNQLTVLPTPAAGLMCWLNDGNLYFCKDGATWSLVA